MAKAVLKWLLREIKSLKKRVTNHTKKKSFFGGWREREKKNNANFLGESLLVYLLLTKEAPPTFGCHPLSESCEKKKTFFRKKEKEKNREGIKSGKNYPSSRIFYFNL